MQPPGFGGCRRWGKLKHSDGRQPVRDLLERHFRPDPLDDLTVSERRFPFRVRADLQRALARPDVTIIEVTQDNRDALPADLEAWVRGNTPC